MIIFAYFHIGARFLAVLVNTACVGSESVIFVFRKCFDSIFVILFVVREVFTVIISDFDVKGFIYRMGAARKYVHILSRNFCLFACI